MVIKKGWVSPSYEINEWDLEDKVKEEINQKRLSMNTSTRLSLSYNIFKRVIKKYYAKDSKHYNGDYLKEVSPSDEINEW